MNKENIKETFLLPIQYRQHIPINDNINNDLELLNTVFIPNVILFPNSEVHLYAIVKYAYLTLNL